MIISITTLVVATFLVVFLLIQNKKLNIKLKQSTLALKLERKYPGSGKPISLENLPVGLSFKSIGQMSDDGDSNVRYHILRSSGEFNVIPEVIIIRIRIDESRLLFKHRNTPPGVFSVFNHAPNKFDVLETIIHDGRVCLLVTHAVVDEKRKPRVPAKDRLRSKKENHVAPLAA